MTAKITSRITMVLRTRSELCQMVVMAPGNDEATEVKIKSDMPLPMPRSVMRSPSHMMSTVPAVIVSTIVVMTFHDWSGTISTGQPGKNTPLRAIVTYEADCRAAKPTEM